ncbi:MAG: hypothetical protein ACFFB0_19790 [Promethearchaeota archaeon]
MKRIWYKYILLIFCIFGLVGTFGSIRTAFSEFDNDGLKLSSTQQKVGILNSFEVSGYFVGVPHNYYSIIYNGLTSNGIDTVLITNYDILMGDLSTIDVLILIDNVPNTDASLIVKDWAQAGGNILSFDSSICFLNWAGLLPPEAEGMPGYGLYWDYMSPYEGVVINDIHPIMAGYGVGDILGISWWGDAQYFSSVMMSSSVGMYYTPLVKASNNNDRDLVVALDNPSYGRVVQIWSQVHWEAPNFHQMILNAINWLRSRMVYATVDFNPNTLNQKSKGKWITVYIELPEGSDVDDIDITSILLNEICPIADSSPSGIGDYDEDGIPDLMVKFDRQAVIGLFNPGENVEIMISGELNDGTPFEGTDTIRVII